ncbi:SOS response-associated peptidase family protein [Parafannyhessea umbonata]|jgi:putative SOS response-associated peptidase YedK|uniref:Abasic site processing protein n=4 Tax=Parafannyhessea umbonata TaxID=604330 RepID=A0A6N7X5C5_9ACTN|nr:SOS response-associated peptidase family protein [Parafannyhessea umbonata]MCI7219640.1 SOS response-associated peptidase [Parafannyhessea umbonata]MDD6358956.1 SOS response-associated peptidase family protein [Parafannyhessea umbonata]MDD7199527.1 SOS response-associated peptidase family protein [Parafannyhessea umbonata]MDY4014056.1 SOS response-associated peptidase family protein [Parafannyhessea umbonata]MDY4419052.1 SOS response-associated peptidase family protein [Parafannyhessea umbo
MCHRMSPLLLRELQEGLKYMQVTGRAYVPRRDPSIVVPDAYPGSQVPLFVLRDDGTLAATELTWGFPSPAQGGRTVFNTRIETALRQATDGRGMWVTPITNGRCIVPVRAFYEWWTQPGTPRAGSDGEASGKRSRRPQVAFQLAGHRIFLIACVRQGERFSVVTTEPNASVASVHNRMPLVLGPGESSVWLGNDWPSLADRSAIQLDRELCE